MKKPIILISFSLIVLAVNFLASDSYFKKFDKTVNSPAYATEHNSTGWLVLRTAPTWHEKGARVTINGEECTSAECKKEFATGEEIVLEVSNVPSGIEFANWTDKGHLSDMPCYNVKEDTCTFTMESDRFVVSTRWEYTEHVVNVKKRGDGSGVVTAEKINCGNNCTATYDNILNQPQEYTLTAKPNSGSTFSHWKTDGVYCKIIDSKAGPPSRMTSNTCTFEVNNFIDRMTETAVFKKKQTSDSGSEPGGNADSGGDTNTTTNTNTTNTTQNATSNNDSDGQQDEEEKPPEPTEATTVTINGEEVTLGSDGSEGNNSGGNAEQDSQSDVSITENQQFTLSGKTVANGKVTLYIFSEPKKATITADENGQWSYTVSGMQPGDHRIETEVTHPETDKTSDRQEVLSFTVTPVQTQVDQSSASATDGIIPADMLWLGGGAAIVVILIGGGGAYWWWRRNGHTQHGKSSRIARKHRDDSHVGSGTPAGKSSLLSGSNSDAGSGSDGGGSD